MSEAVAVAVGKVYPSDDHGNQGKIKGSDTGGFKYLFAKVVSGSNFINKGDTLTLGLGGLAVRAVSDAIDAVAVCDINAVSADQWALVLIASKVPFRVNIGTTGTTGTAASAMGNRPLVYSASASGAGQVKDGTITSCTGSDSVVAAGNVSTFFNTMQGEIEAIEASQLYARGTASITGYGASSYRFLDSDYEWTVGDGVVSTTAVADVGASAVPIDIGTILSIKSSAGTIYSYPVTASATGVSGIIINVASAFPPSISTYDATDGSGNAPVKVSLYQAPAIFRG